MIQLDLLPLLLGGAVLVPLLSFALIVIFGPKMGPSGQVAGVVATLAIVFSFVLSMLGFFVWISHNFPSSTDHAHADHHVASPSDEHHEVSSSNEEGHGHDAHEDSDHTALDKPAISGIWYTLGNFGRLQLNIGYYIDTLTVCMFCMVTLIASCIHVYAIGYMHEELHDVEDQDVTLRDGSYLTRPGRFHRFFQYLSLFCFSMLGLVVSGNVAMTFVFWELVGICSYFLIGFYVERPSASAAANKAFIVNRIGDFGMIIGLMAIWASLGTFNFGNVDQDGDGTPEAGLFRLVRPGGENNYKLIVPDGMVQAAAHDEVRMIVLEHLHHPDGMMAAESEIAARTDGWRQAGLGYWLLVVAGIGIFCGCVGKSAQFPLHTWLPDAMEGPTPVSALVHSATMVAAGVFLVGRFYPVFAPEVLLVIAVVGCATLFMAATIAITATDIKRVLAYSTVSQLGYMMLGLGVGGWLAGMFHLFTHAFFKSLLFLGSGSVIHAVHTNEMTQMGGLRKKMPWTAYTMLIGCLAIIGAPFFSGFYSKDAILEQAFLFKQFNPLIGSIFFYAAMGGAAMTAFYMFRLWFLTFAGKPRDEDRYAHAHESPPVMYVPLVILAIFAVAVAWKVLPLNLSDLLEQARAPGTLVAEGKLVEMIWPDEHLSHDPEIKSRVMLMAFFTAFSGVFLAAAFYGLRYLNADDARRQFQSIHRFLINKWWFDELYDVIWVRPVMFISSMVAGLDRRWIDWLVDGLAHLTVWFSGWGDRWVDRRLVDGAANLLARWTYSTGLSLRQVQTGRLRDYVVFIVVGTVGAFVLFSFFFWSYSVAG